MFSVAKVTLQSPMSICLSVCHHHPPNLTQHTNHHTDTPSFTASHTVTSSFDFCDFLGFQFVWGIIEDTFDKASDYIKYCVFISFIIPERIF